MTGRGVLIRNLNGFALRARAVPRLAAALFLAALLLKTGAVQAREQAPEYQIKAAYLYNFILFTSWPEDEPPAKSMPENIIRTGILGCDPFGSFFEDVEGKEVKPGRRLQVDRLGPFESRPDLNRCGVLFISASEKNSYKDIISALGRAPVLTIGETPGFVEAGGMVELVRLGKKIRWTVNQAAAEAAGLRLSSQLLRNAIRVVKPPRE